MTEKPVQGLLENYRSALKLVADVVSQFKPDQWQSPAAGFQVPWKVSYHIVDCLDYYFREKPDEEYAWGHRFGGGWWKLKENQIPGIDEVLGYLHEMEDRIVGHLSALKDEDLVRPFDAEREHGKTRLAHTIYALRHTMHHHGALSLMSLRFGNPDGLWE